MSERATADIRSPRGAGLSSDDRVTNFSKDVSDGENYTVLLNQLKPAECSRAPLQETDLHQRAEKVCGRSLSNLHGIKRLTCRPPPPRSFKTPTRSVAANT